METHSKWVARVVWIWISISAIVLITFLVTGLSIKPLNYNNSVILLTLFFLAVYWAMLTSAYKFKVGIFYFVQQLREKSRALRESDREKYTKQIVERLRTTYETTSNFATIAVALTAILVAAAATIRLVLESTSIFLEIAVAISMLGTLVLIHCVDVCDTAMNPGISISMLEHAQNKTVKYYGIGLFALVSSILVGTAAIEPSLTAIGSIIYMITIGHYFFGWHPGSSDSETTHANNDEGNQL